eukprot:TRINITY_DN12569_c0_g1_i1.p1 TRINITY_DN12569_c0_g1~~TRINITY_DN12569_c0_g1_i1.p1  ORF type:complete len:195 (+),score=25.78 TRINITY_DN12569_c0_g1_i1:20-604(+)
MEEHREYTFLMHSLYPHHDKESQSRGTLGTVPLATPLIHPQQSRFPKNHFPIKNYRVASRSTILPPSDNIYIDDLPPITTAEDCRFENEVGLEAMIVDWVANYWESKVRSLNEIYGYNEVVLSDESKLVVAKQAKLFAVGLINNMFNLHFLKVQVAPPRSRPHKVIEALQIMDITPSLLERILERMIQHNLKHI